MQRVQTLGSAKAGSCERGLRLVTYNIHKGVRGFGPLGRLEIHNLRGALQGLNADIICLQEVRGFNTQQARRFTTWPQGTQAEYLRPHGYYCVYTSNAVTRHGEHGNALISRWPIIKVQHEDVSDHKLEQRGLLHVIIDFLGTPVHVIVLHLGLLASSRRRQVAHLGRFIAREIMHDTAREITHAAKQISKESVRLIVAGDFNDWSAALVPLMKEIGLVPTHLGALNHYKSSSAAHENALPPLKRLASFPSRLPLVQLDYVYTNAAFVNKTFAPKEPHWRKLSDHLPLIVEFSNILDIVPKAQVSATDE